MIKEITRKEFLQKLAVLGFAVVGAGVTLASCGGGKEEAQVAATPTKKAKPAAADPCADTTGLTDAELNMRQTLQYVTKTPEPEKLCDNCKFWTPPEAGTECGGCQLIKGPINAKGYCTSWFTKEA